jgi:serine/threonine protein kinase
MLRARGPTRARMNAIEIGQIAPGQLFAGRYRVVRLIKAGGMGAVYEAVHEQTRRRVALKVMRPEIVSDPVSRARFVQEAQVATLIESKHVVDVLDAGVDDATAIPFLVMEFLTGEEVGDLVQRLGRVAPSDAVAWLTQAARALDKAHARGVVHRDLKPENLYLALREDEPPTLKILDFGIAKVLQSVAHNSTRGTGTPLYMAPEQTRRSSQVGPPTDVWALGLVAYTMIVGRPYWEAEDVHQLLGEILVEPMEPPVQRAARWGTSLPPGFDAWFFATVNRDPAQRYPRAGDSVAALAAVFGFAPDSRLPPPPPPPSAYAQQQAHALAATMPLSSVPSGAMAATTGSPVQSGPEALPPVSRSRAPSRMLLLIGGTLVAAIAVGTVIGLSVKKGTTDEASAQTEETARTKKKASPAGPGTSDDGKSLATRIQKTNPFVTVDKLAVQRHEVTRAEFAAFLESLPEKDRVALRPIEDWTEPLDKARMHRPVTWVTWERADRFCKAIDARLPTSVEWTASMPRKYPWGDPWPTKLTDVAIARGEDAQPVDVESSPSDKTPDDIADLAGNVQEWTATVADGLATIKGATVAMSAEDAKGAIVDGLGKFTEAGAGQGAKREVIAGSRLGFRCVKKGG